jgi:hypothetical protein
MSPFVYVAVGALVAGGLGGWTVRDWKADSDAIELIGKSDKLRDRLQAQTEASAEKYEQGRASAQPADRAGRDTIREIYRNAPPVPVECSIPDAVALVLDAARQRANAAAGGQSGAAVPGPSADPPQRP